MDSPGARCFERRSPWGVRWQSALRTAGAAGRGRPISFVRRTAEAAGGRDWVRPRVSSARQRRPRARGTVARVGSPKGASSGGLGASARQPAGVARRRSDNLRPIDADGSCFSGRHLLPHSLVGRGQACAKAPDDARVRRGSRRFARPGWGRPVGDGYWSILRLRRGSTRRVDAGRAAPAVAGVIEAGASL